MSHILLFLSPLLWQLSEGNPKNRGALQESFVISLKAIKNECETNTGNLLAVIHDLQQNQNLSLVKTLNEETQSLKKLVNELNKTIEQQNRNDEEKQSKIEQQTKLFQEQNRTIQEQQAAIHELMKTVGQLNKTIGDQQLMIDRLNETDVKDLKGEVDALEFAVEEQRQMIQWVNESRRSRKCSE